MLSVKSFAKGSTMFQINNTKIKMPNMKNTWLLVLIVCALGYIACLAAYFFWGMDQFYAALVAKPTVEQQEIISQIDATRAEIGNMPNVVDERQAELYKAQADLDTEAGMIPYKANINDIVGTVIDLAGQYGVSAMPLRAQLPATAEINGYDYIIWNVRLSVSGDYENLVGFVDKIDGKDIPVANVRSIILERGGAAEDGDDTAVTGTLELVIYTNPVDHEKESR